MDITVILISAGIVAAVGIFVGLFLGIAGIAFKVETDPREDEIASTLPGNNCGGCGYPGCSGLATAIVKGEAPVNACPVGGADVGNKIAAIMGVEAGETIRKTAYVSCSGDCAHASTDYQYTGAQDCRMLSFVPNGGPKACNSGCLGFGTCAKTCVFDAIHVVNGVAVVDKDKCKACGKCVAVCPKNLISIIPYDAKYAVACVSKDKGPVTIKACKSGCVGCSLCVKNCPTGAVSVNDFHASINQEKCIGCGVCAEKCPRKVIVKITDEA